MCYSPWGHKDKLCTEYTYAMHYVSKKINKTYYPYIKCIHYLSAIEIIHDYSMNDFLLFLQKSNNLWDKTTHKESLEKREEDLQKIGD